MNEQTEPKIFHRRIRVRLDLEADDVSAVIDTFDEIQHTLAQKDDIGEETADVVSGGYSSSWRLDMTCDTEQTPERYREQILAWKASQRAGDA